MTDTPSDIEAARRWLAEAIRRSGLKPTPFAKKAGVAPSTILRALEPDGPALQLPTIEKLRQTFDLPALGEGFSEDELTPYDAGPPPAPNQYMKRVTTRALELAGVLPGDVLTLDMATPPVGGDVVDAQVYQHDRDGAETVLRLYEPPFLIAATLDPNVSRRPAIVDGFNVRIVGVMLRLARLRTG